MLIFVATSALLERMTIALKTEKREVFGKKLKPYREQGKLPVVCYGAGEENRPFWVSEKEFGKVWKAAGESTIIELDTPEGKKNVLIQDVAMDAVKGEPIHADFLAVRMDKPIVATVPLVFSGEAPVVKALGGVLVKVLREIEVEALPKNLPHEITVDISSLATFDDQISVGDLALPDGVSAELDATEVVVLAEPPRVEEEAKTERTIADIEVVGKEKKEETEGETEGSSPKSTSPKSAKE